MVVFFGSVSLLLCLLFTGLGRWVVVFFGDVCKPRFQKSTHGQSCDLNRPCFGAKTEKHGFHFWTGLRSLGCPLEPAKGRQIEELLKTYIRIPTGTAGVWWWLNRIPWACIALGTGGVASIYVSKNAHSSVLLISLAPKAEVTIHRWERNLSSNLKHRLHWMKPQAMRNAAMVPKLQEVGKTPSSQGDLAAACVVKNHQLHPAGWFFSQDSRSTW